MYSEPGIKIDAFSLKNVVEMNVVTPLTWLLRMLRFLTTLIKGCFKSNFQLFLAATSLITMRNYLDNCGK